MPDHISFMQIKLVWILFVCTLGINTCFSQQLQNKATIIYLIRHAEKDMRNPADKNPPLSSEGETRARYLVEKFKDENIEAIYSTDFTRTRNTVQPLADSKKARVQLYKGADYEEIRNIAKAGKGKTMLICGHSNTLIPMIKTLGGQAPFDQIDENTYNTLFKLVIHPDGTTKTTVEKYP